MNFDLQLSAQALRRVLALDAASGALTGVLHLALAGSLALWLGLPEALITGSGWAIFVFVSVCAVLARQARPARGPLMGLILANGVWGLACLWLAWGAGWPVTPLGQAYLTVQAVAVLVLADLEFLGWRLPAPEMQPG